MTLRAVLTLLLVSTIASAASVDAASTVRRLYRDYAWEVVMADHKDLTSLMAESRSTLERYFDHQLADLIAKDRECSASKHEVCNLDFSPIWSGQDPGATELTATATSDPTVVLVQFHHPLIDKPMKLTYNLARSPAGWRIVNIKGEGPGGQWDLVETLRQK